MGAFMEEVEELSLPSPAVCNITKERVAHVEVDNGIDPDISGTIFVFLKKTRPYLDQPVAKIRKLTEEIVQSKQPVVFPSGDDNVINLMTDIAGLECNQTTISQWAGPLDEGQTQAVFHLSSNLEKVEKLLTEVVGNDAYPKLNARATELRAWVATL